MLDLGLPLQARTIEQPVNVMPNETDFVFEDPEHFEEGLLHLVDMLELTDPRRAEALESQAKVLEAGVAAPVGGTFEEWRGFCLNIAGQLKAARGKVTAAEGQAMLDATIDRLEQMAE